MTKAIDFRFDEEKHQYTLNGCAKLPSVTQIITDVYGRRSWWGDYYAQKGKALHLAVKYFDYGDLDWESIDPVTIPRLNAYQRFKEFYNPKIKFSEFSMFHSKYRFAGTADQIWENDEIMDIKSSIDAAAFIQLGGYCLLYLDNFKRQIKKAHIIQLNENGTFQPKTFSGLEIKRLQQEFLNTLSVHNIKARYKL